MPKIKVNDINLYYEEHGEGDPIVFVTGLSADHTTWDINIKDFSDKYHVIAVDNRGCGQSDAPDYPYTIEMMTDDLAVLCKTLNLPPAHFIGVSMGGMIVQNIAYKYPEITKSIVVSNSASKLNNDRCRLFCEAYLNLMIAKTPLETMVKLGMTWTFSNRFLRIPGIIEVVTKMSKDKKYPITAIGYKNQVAANFSFDSSSWAHKINKPCLVLDSDDEMCFLREDIQALAKTIPNAQYFCFTGGIGHVPSLEDPAKFKEVVLEFIISLR
jgi:pimeloyl-ACP methyl ester carboxylesterase